jgi:hypothetical protein
VLQPLDGFAVELFLNGDVGHRRGWRGAVPVLFAGSKPDYISGMDFLDGPAPALRTTAARGDNKGLAERVRMPRGARAGFKGDVSADYASGFRRIEKRINPYGAGEVVSGAST